MRDILTVVASLVILVLAAALIVPPLVDWEARRGLIEGAITRSTGVEARTEGRLELRLLPSPRIRIDALRLGSEQPHEPSLQARLVKAEMGLTPLLRGEVRVKQVRIARAEVRIPTSEGGPKIAPRLLDDAVIRRELAVDDLVVNQLLLTTIVPATGRTDQFYAEGVRVEARSLAGPWTVQGTAGTAPFRIATGVLGPDRTLPIKLAGGGNLTPRFDLDTRLGFRPVENGLLAPVLSGTAKVLLGPPAQAATAGLPIPVLLQATFKAAADGISLEPVSVEAGEGGASLRLTGTGAVRLDEPGIRLKLEGRRLDIDSFILSPSGRELASRSGTWQPPLVGVPIELDLSINSLGFAQEELQNLVIRGALLRGQVRAERIEVTGPGQTRVALQGEAGLTGQGGISGRVALQSAASDRFGRYLARLGAPGRLTALMDGRPLEASAEVSLGPPVTSLRGVRVQLGGATLTGNARYAAPEGDTRGRVEAQIGMSGVDLDELPRVAELVDASQAVDIGFTLDARDVRHAGRPGAGRITAKILSDGPSLFVETLEIADLAGANARASGRINPDGSGRITGNVAAPRAAPLIDLLGSVWIGDASRLVPGFLREREINLDIIAERAGLSPASAEPRLRTVAKGSAAGGQLEVEAVSAEARTQSLAVRIATDNTGIWVDRADVPTLRRPSVLELRGVRQVGGAFNVTASGDLGGLRVRTTRPFAIGEGDAVVESGELDLAAADVTPFLVLLGDGAGVRPPVPVQLRVTLGRDLDATLLQVGGKIAGDGVQARLTARTRSDVSGEVSLDRLSLPWLTTSMALNAGPDPNAAALWSSTRFGQTGRLLRGGQVRIAARQVVLGRGLEGEGAKLLLLLDPDGLEIRDFAAALAGGRLTGALRIARQGSQATLTGEGRIAEASLPELVANPAYSGRLSASLRAGGVGETMSAVVNNLTGAGEAQVADLTFPEADPAALDRALLRILADPDPLQRRRIDTVVAEELARGPLRAAQFTAPVTIIGGLLRLNPVVADAGPAIWRGTAALDLRTLQLDARGLLTAVTVPESWAHGAPQIGLAWRGPVSRPTREVDTAPLTGGVAAIVLQRELDKVEAFQADAEARSRAAQQERIERAAPPSGTSRGGVGQPPSGAAPILPPSKPPPAPSLPAMPGG